jgi:hypothetical protein
MATRFMGLDIHRDYCVAAAVDAKQQVVYGPRRIPNSEVERWMVQELSPHDAVVLEMTTNTWTMVDLLRPHVESVTVVHPPHVKLITRAKVMTDKKASLALAQLHAAGLLPASGFPRPTPRPARRRRDLRHAMVEAAQAAARTHPYWKTVYARLEPRLGRNKTIVAIARKLLVAVWHVLSEQTGDRRADAVNVAKSLFKLAYRMGVRNLPEGMSALAFTRIQLDRLGLGAELMHLPWSGKRYKLPPSVRAGPGSPLGAGG